MADSVVDNLRYDTAGQRQCGIDARNVVESDLANSGQIDSRLNWRVIVSALMVAYLHIE